MWHRGLKSGGYTPRLRGLRWTGDAAVTQAAAHTQWSDAVEDLQTALGALRSIATTAHSNYTAALAANRRMWTS